jgi:hypothetical protein
MRQFTFRLPVVSAFEVIYVVVSAVVIFVVAIEEVVEPMYEI